MLNRFALLILTGLFTILPFALTFYFLMWAITGAESVLSPLIPKEYYFPGMGLLIIGLFLAFIGLLVKAYVVKMIFTWGYDLIDRVPIVKTLFGAIQDAVELFQIKKDHGTKKAVAVEITQGVQLIGFVTSDQVAKTLFPNQNKVAVYLPLSFQIGGYTLYLDRSKITDLDIDVETAMRIAVTGGNSITPKTKRPSDS